MNRVSLTAVGSGVILITGIIIMLSTPNYLGENPPEWVVFPGEQWETMTPEEAGLDGQKFKEWVGSQNPIFGKAAGGQEPERGGVVITRGGYVIHTWGDANYAYQSASLGKTFTRMLLQLAIDQGLIGSVIDLVGDYWTGEGELEPHKVLNKGFHRTLTFKHLREMVGGFPVSNGHFWSKNHQVPTWAKYSGNPAYDNYAHVEPGAEVLYSSGGYWRLSQILTFVWKRDLKQVLDDEIMSKIGIPSYKWRWLSGEEVKKDDEFYSLMPGYGDYLDPPYRIGGIVVRGGPGWVVMSSNDLARVGLLIATGGIWEGEKLINEIGGNSGVQENTVMGWGRLKKWGFLRSKDGYFSFGKVATDFEDPVPETMVQWIVRAPQRSSPR